MQSRAMTPREENDPDQLTIPVGSQPPPATRGFDSLGPSRSLPARPAATRNPALARIATVVATLAALALFALPSSRGGESSRVLLAQTLSRITDQGLPLRDVRCPKELTLERGEPFSCAARAEGVSLRIELMPAASTRDGAVDSLRVRIEGAAGVARVAGLAAQRYGRQTQVTCPRRYWVDKPGASERCTLKLGAQSGPLTVVSRADGALALHAPWVDAQQPHATTQ